MGICNPHGITNAVMRLCAFSRMANHRSVFHSYQQFQEKDNKLSTQINRTTLQHCNTVTFEKSKWCGEWREREINILI
jgi:hypothetical protein